MRPRCLLRLAQAEHGQSLTLPEIAAGEGLSVPYVAKLLSRNGVVAISRLDERRKAKFRYHSGGAQRGDPGKNFAPRQRAMISTATLTTKLMNTHEGCPFIRECAACTADFVRTRVTERFADHTYSVLRFQA